MKIQDRIEIMSNIHKNNPNIFIQFESNKNYKWIISMLYEEMSMNKDDLYRMSIFLFGKRADEIRFTIAKHLVHFDYYYEKKD